MLNEVFSDEVDWKCRGDSDRGLSGDLRQLVVTLNEGYGLPRQDYNANEKLYGYYGPGSLLGLL